MKHRLTVFGLGRMRHLDLLALWFRLHPANHHGHDAVSPMGRLSKECLAAAILNAARK